MLKVAYSVSGLESELWDRPRTVPYLQVIAVVAFGSHILGDADPRDGIVGKALAPTIGWRGRGGEGRAGPSCGQRVSVGESGRSEGQCGP